MDRIGWQLACGKGEENTSSPVVSCIGFSRGIKAIC